jgi:hypothetical protein
VEELSVDGRVILKWMFKKLDLEGTWAGSKQEQLDIFECGNKVSRFIQCEEFID